MKKYLFVVVLLSVFCACGNKNEKDKSSATPARVADTVAKVIGIGKIEPESDIIQLSSPVSGIVAHILKHENDSVASGTPILELDHEIENAKVRQQQTQLATQSAQINADEASIEEFAAKFNNATQELQRLQRLLAKGAETQQAVDNAVTNVKAYESNFKRLRATAAVSKSRLSELRAGLQLAIAERDQKIIRSPVDGKILEISTLMGSSIDTRQAFGQIGPKGKIIAVSEIDEMYADKVQVGQSAWIRNVGSLDTLAIGTVYFASSFLKKKSLFTDQAGEKEDRRVRTVKISLNNPEKLLLNARIECVINISGNPKK